MYVGGKERERMKSDRLREKERKGRIRMRGMKKGVLIYKCLRHSN